MTVPEPTPEPRRGRMSVLRRLSFAIAAVALTATFGVALSGIASTQGTLRPDGQAATLAARDAPRSAGDAASRHRDRDCPREGRRSRGASRRV
jgi:hypothetical protein